MTPLQTQRGVAGKTIEMKCDAVAAPQVNGVIWIFMGKNIEQGDHDIFYLVFKYVRNYETYSFGT